VPGATIVGVSLLGVGQSASWPCQIAQLCPSPSTKHGMVDRRHLQPDLMDARDENAQDLADHLAQNFVHLNGVGLGPYPANREPTRHPVEVDQDRDWPMITEYLRKSPRFNLDGPQREMKSGCVWSWAYPGSLTPARTRTVPFLPGRACPTDAMTLTRRRPVLAVRTGWGTCGWRHYRCATRMAWPLTWAYGAGVRLPSGISRTTQRRQFRSVTAIRRREIVPHRSASAGLAQIRRFSARGERAEPAGFPLPADPHTDRRTSYA